mmetsp:Transcript_25214/g.83291  ORF Transcript_25214/g.83291 Transcript_25214/m.83291 type:complete len:217 (-) Transcript_25214:435-1085(-)
MVPNPNHPRDPGADVLYLLVELIPYRCKPSSVRDVANVEDERHGWVRCHVAVHGFRRVQGRERVRVLHTLVRGMHPQVPESKKGDLGGASRPRHLERLHLAEATGLTPDTVEDFLSALQPLHQCRIEHPWVTEALPRCVSSTHVFASVGRPHLNSRLHVEDVLRSPPLHHHGVSSDGVRRPTDEHLVLFAGVGQPPSCRHVRVLELDDVGLGDQHC